MQWYIYVLVIQLYIYPSWKDAKRSSHGVARTMGATTSRSEQILRDDIATLEASLVATQRPIDFDNEQSATAHSALNTLKNAYYHRQSSRVGRLRSAAVAKFVCTGARSSAAEVRFEPHAMDIDSYQLLPLRCDHKGLQLPKERVPTGMCAPAPPAPPPAFFFSRKPCCEEQHGVEKHDDALRRTPSSSSSVCSLDDTVPHRCVPLSEPPAGADAAAASADSCNRCADSAPVRPASWESKSSLSRLSYVEVEEPQRRAGTAGMARLDSEPLADLCDILTTGGRCLSPAGSSNTSVFSVQ